MPTKKKAGAKRKPVLKDATRASDDALREQLRHFDVQKFGKVLAKAIKQPGTGKAR